MHVSKNEEIKNATPRIIAKKRNNVCTYEGNIKIDNNVTNKTYLKQDTREWLSNHRFANAFAVTLTLKQNPYVGTFDDKYYGYDSIDTIKAAKNLKHFLNVINGKFYGRKSKHKDISKCQRINCIPFQEGNPSGLIHLHYHLILEKPSYAKDIQISDGAFIRLIRNIWNETIFGNEQIEVEKIYCFNGWLEYCTKNSVNMDGNLNLDIENLWLPKSSYI